MKLSKNGENFIKKYEGFYDYWYDLKDGGLTCGFGTYITYAEAKRRGIKVGDKTTKEQAQQYLDKEVAGFVSGTNALIKQYNHKVNQNQFDALVSYAYNRGLGNSFGTNGLRQLLKNSKSNSDISKNFMIYWGTNTMYKKGLLNRRAAEKALFDTPVNSQTINKPTSNLTGIKRYTVTADLLNIRKSPSNSGKVLGQLKKGQTVQVVSIDKDGWAKIKSNDTFVYVFSKYLSL